MDTDRERINEMDSHEGRSPKSLLGIGRLHTDMLEDGGLSASYLGCVFGWFWKYLGLAIDR